MKNKLKVKKFIKKKLYGGRLKELKAPNKNNNSELNIKVFFNLTYALFN